MRKRKDEWMRKGDLSGWFVLALITPLGLDKLTDCHTYCHMHTHTHTHRKIFFFHSDSAAFCLLSVCVVCVSILYVHGLCARTGVHGSV